MEKSFSHIEWKTLIEYEGVNMIRMLLVAVVISSCIAFGSDTETWTGYVTDTHCGTNCQRTSDMKPDIKCIRLCVKKGSKYGLWSGNRVLLLEPQNEAARFAAKNVEVHGTMANGVIQIKSIRVAGEAK